MATSRARELLVIFDPNLEVVDHLIGYCTCGARAKADPSVTVIWIRDGGTQYRAAVDGAGETTVLKVGTCEARARRLTGSDSLSRASH